MDFYLSFNNNAEQIRLPVTPSSFKISQKHNNTVLNITSIGEINLIGNKGLASLTISSFFPSSEYYFCKYFGFPKPYEFVKTIQKWKNSCKPIRVIVTGTPINYAMGIDEFSFSEEDGTGDVYFTLSLNEYIFTKQAKPYQTTTPNGTQIVTPQTKRETKPIPTSKKVQEGDNIYTVAKNTTGSMSNAKAIAKTNKIDQHKGMDLVKGTVVLI